MREIAVTTTARIQSRRARTSRGQRLSLFASNDTNRIKSFGKRTKQKLKTNSWPPKLPFARPNRVGGESSPTFG